MNSIFKKWIFYFMYKVSQNIFVVSKQKTKYRNNNYFLVNTLTQCFPMKYVLPTGGVSFKSYEGAVTEIISQGAFWSN